MPWQYFEIAVIDDYQKQGADMARGST